VFVVFVGSLLVVDAKLEFLALCVGFLICLWVLVLCFCFWFLVWLFWGFWGSSCVGFCLFGGLGDWGFFLLCFMFIYDWLGLSFGFLCGVLGGCGIWIYFV